MRHDPRRLCNRMFIFYGSWVLLMKYSTLYICDTALTIFLLSVAITLWFMIRREIIPVDSKRFYRLAAVCGCILTVFVCVNPYQERRIRGFLAPQTEVESLWDDTYNGILIQELLSGTPWVGELELSQEEMMNYGTGAWYFAERDPRKIGIVFTGEETEAEKQEFHKQRDELREEGDLPRIIEYGASSVDLWKILPQHYDTNYVIAVFAFLHGRIPGLIFTAVILLFYDRLFACIRQIHGKLASSLAFCCGQCLLWQGAFCILGNFGYQYATFPNMPMLAEGRISIVLNMGMLGMILSAYRYDHVTEEPGDVLSISKFVKS